MEEAKKNIRLYKQEKRYYYDQEFRKLLEDFKIDALYSLNNGRFITNRSVDAIGINEQNSSFTFAGLTGIAKELGKRLDENSIKYHCMFGGLSPEEFKNLGIYFTDDTIQYNTFTKIGKVQKKPVERKNMWPRSLDISINEDLLPQEFYNIFIEYLKWALVELETKGTYKAMDPMRKRVK